MTAFRPHLFLLAVPLLLLGGTRDLGAQTVIRGVLLDERTDLPVSAGVISLVNDRRRIVMSAETNSEGYFEVEAGAAGNYLLRSQRLGYRNTASAPMNLVAGDTLSIEFRISPDAVFLAPVTVTATARRWWENAEPVVLWSFYERMDLYERMGMGRFLVREQIEPFDGMTVTQFLQTVPGIRVARVDFGGSAVDYPTLRGDLANLRPCQPEFFLDGARLRLRDPLDPDFSRGDTIDAYIQTSAIVGVEVYDGAAILPGEFGGMNSNCGVIALWTSRQG